MTEFANTIIYNGIRYTKYYMPNKRTKYLVSEDEANSIQLKELKQYLIDIVCSQCLKCTTTHYKSRFIYKPYLCHSCSITGFRNGFFGKKHSADSINKQQIAKFGKNIGSDNPMYNKSWKTIVKAKMTELQYAEYIKVRSETASKRVSGRLNPFYGKSHSEKTRKILSDKNKVYALNPIVKEKQRLAAINRMKSGKYKMTVPEKIMKKLLVELDVEHHYNYVLHKKYQYDFRLPNSNILIEVHGDYWHCNPKFYPNGAISDRQKFKIQRDSEKLKYAVDNGYRIMYFWEYDLKNNINQIKERILHDIQTSSNNKN